MKLEIEKLRIQNENKEYRIKNPEEDFENVSDTKNEESVEYNIEDNMKKVDVNHKYDEDSVLHNGDMDDLFQTEIADGKTLFICHLCDYGFEELDRLKKHLSSKHEEVIVTQSSNAIREWSN